MRFNMYLYFQKEKPEGEDKPDDGKPRGRFIVRAVIMIALIYLCVRFVYLSPVDMVWIWIIESKMNG